MNATYKAKTVKMQGFNGREEDVVPARERLLELKSTGTPYNIQTEPIEFMGKGFFKCLLTILLNPIQYFTGSSEIKREEVGGFEAAETRSIGRALAAYGVAIENSFASADEFEGKLHTVDPEAKNSVKEVLNQLAIVKERQGNTEGYVEPSVDQSALGAQSEAPKEIVRRRTAPKNVTAKSPEHELVLKTGQNVAETVEIKAEIQPEVAEIPKNEVHVENVQQEPEYDEQSSFHNMPKPQEQPKTIAVEAKPTLAYTNQFDIVIPELVNGARNFNVYLPEIVMKLQEKDVDMEEVSAAIVKLGLADFISPSKDLEHWELLLKTASPVIINTVLNAVAK